MLIGSAAISAMAFGDPFLEDEDAAQISGWRILAFIPQAALYASGSLIAFVPWIRIVLGLQPAKLVAFLPQHLKVAPVWLLAWVVMPFVVGLALLVVLIPLTFMFIAAGGAASAEGDANALVDVATAAFVVAAITFAIARLLLRASLISADLAQSAIAPRVLGSWVRAAGALILAVVPLTALGLVIGQAFQSIDWMVHAIGVVDELLFTLVLGAVCANVIRAGECAGN